MSEDVQNIYAELRRLDVNIERLAERFERAAERHQLQHDTDRDQADCLTDLLQGNLDDLSERVSRLERR